MNPSLAAALVAAMLTATWLLGRRRQPLLRDTDTSGVAALNRAQLVLVRSGAAVEPVEPTVQEPGRVADSESVTPASPAESPLATPLSVPALRAAVRAAGGPQAYRARLEALYRGDGPSRLRAISVAHQWGDRRILPLLRRALRDSDPAVIRAAVLAIERFRGRAAAPPSPQPRPRRVARTR